ncbi:MAG: bifunctional 4-hydroxy-2-oxoglutarate aldolase/2-dehydro-3-deoxy-phosphogluconate aldolase [Chloroflexota bacterium]
MSSLHPAPARPGLPAALVAGRIVAIGRRLPSSRAEAVAGALADAGVTAFEITLNAPVDDALAGIALCARRFGDRMRVGAGTVRSIADARRAIEAGATFLVSPHTDVALVRWAAERGIATFPGAFTPTEIVTAWDAGATAVKLFPAPPGP